MNTVLERIWEEVVMAYSEAAHRLPGRKGKITVHSVSPISASLEYETHCYPLDCDDRFRSRY
jgi:hypothetical protein